MAVYLIGDVQGCMSALQRLTHRIAYSPSRDTLYFLGDMVNRGSDSVGVLRWVMAEAEKGSAHALLGNHDLHLLACAAGVRHAKPHDTLHNVLQAPDSVQLLRWLRHLPIALYQHNVLMVHAGILPQWSVLDTLAYAEEVHAALRGTDHKECLHNMYGNLPRKWCDTLQGAERLRVLLNVFTRMRFCSFNGTLNLEAKGAPEDAPPGYRPWFAFPERRARHSRIAFGHWSALGTYVKGNIMAIDSGCVWGGALTAIRIDGGRRDVIQVACRHGKNS